MPDDARDQLDHHQADVDQQAGPGRPQPPLQLIQDLPSPVAARMPPACLLPMLTGRPILLRVCSLSSYQAIGRQRGYRTSAIR